MGKEDELFAFLDGLSSWAKTKLQRRVVQDLASALAAAESLNEYKRDSSKRQGKKNSGSGKGGGDGDKSPKRDKPSTDKGKGKKTDAPRKHSCFLCNGPHRAFECPKKGKLVAIVQKEEE